MRTITGEKTGQIAAALNYDTERATKQSLYVTSLREAVKDFIFRKMFAATKQSHYLKLSSPFYRHCEKP